MSCFECHKVISLFCCFLKYPLDFETVLLLEPGNTQAITELSKIKKVVYFFTKMSSCHLVHKFISYIINLRIFDSHYKFVFKELIERGHWDEVFLDSTQRHNVVNAVDNPPHRGAPVSTALSFLPALECLMWDSPICCQYQWLIKKLV